MYSQRRLPVRSVSQLCSSFHTEFRSSMCTLRPCHATVVISVLQTNNTNNNITLPVTRHPATCGHPCSPALLGIAFTQDPRSSQACRERSTLPQPRRRVVLPAYGMCLVTQVLVAQVNNDASRQQTASWAWKPDASCYTRMIHTKCLPDACSLTRRRSGPAILARFSPAFRGGRQACLSIRS